MNKDLLKIIQDVGLSENQARVYLAGLQIGKGTPTDIAKIAEIKRTTVYPVLENLLDLGLVKITMKGFKKLYEVESPEKLENILEKKQESFKKSISQLNAIYKLDLGQSNINYFEGISSIKKVYNSLLKDVKRGEDYFIISSPDDWYETDPEFFQDFIERRSKLDIKIRCLLKNSKIAKDYKKNSQNYNLRAKFLPKDTSFTANIVIIPKKILIHQLHAPSWALIIENPAIVKTHQELFEIIWKVIPDK